MKSQLVSLLKSGDLHAVAWLAGEHKRALSWLTGLTYHADPLVADRAVEAFGPAAARIASYDPEYVRNHLRRLLWLVNDESGGIGWRAPELVGAAIAHCRRPDGSGQFDEFISPLVYLLDMPGEDAPRFRRTILVGIGFIARRQPETLRFARSLLLDCLADPSAYIRSQAQDCLDRISAAARDGAAAGVAATTVALPGE